MNMITFLLYKNPLYPAVTVLTFLHALYIIMAYHHFKLLVQISDALSQPDLRDLVFCCGNAVPEATAEKISSGVDLFKILKHQNHLGPGQYGYLRRRLEAIGRVDLANRLPSELESMLCQVPQHKKHLSHKNGHIRPSSPVQAPGLPTASADRAFSSRAQLLQVAANLTSDDLSKLAYLFANKLSRNFEDEMTATSLLLQLESIGAISPCQPQTVSCLLHEIGRKDLASLILSVQVPQSPHTSFESPYQLLLMKISMLTNKRSQYSFQRKQMSTVISSNKTVQISDPVEQSLCGSSTIHRLCSGSFKSIQHTVKLDELAKSTLPIVFDFTEAYLSVVYHNLICDGGTVRINSIKPLFKMCQKYYKIFEEEIGQFQWNRVLRAGIQEDLTQGRTPIGSPALKAVSCIYEVCSELSGRGEGLYAVKRDVEDNICTLDSLHHSYCCGVVLTQWLESILCLLTCNDDTTIPGLLQSTLLQIATRYHAQISSVYCKVAAIMGEAAVRRVAERLSQEGVYIDSQEAVSFHRRRHSGCESSIYVCNISTTAYVNLFLLLHLSFLGSENLDLSNVFSRLKEFSSSFVASTLYMTSTARLYKNLVNAFEVQIDKFNKEALGFDPLCMPVLRRFVSI